MDRGQKPCNQRRILACFYGGYRATCFKVQNQLLLKQSHFTSMASYSRVTVVIVCRLSGYYPKN